MYIYMQLLVFIGYIYASVSFAFFSVPSRSCVLAGADAPMNKQAIAVSAIAFLMTLLPVTRVPPVSWVGGGSGVD